MYSFMFYENTFTKDTLFNVCKVCARMGWHLSREKNCGNALMLTCPDTDAELAEFIFAEFV